MKTAAPSYPLELQFLQRGDPQGVTRRMYTAGVEVTIRDSAGRIVLEATAAGPFLLARLPDGECTIRADDDGQVVTRRARVDQGKHQTIVFEWGT